MKEERKYPNASSLMTEQDVLAVRKSLPKLRAGDPLQGYKHALSCRLRAIRMKAAGRLSLKEANEIVASAPECCPICGEKMRHWLTSRSPSIDHIVPLAKGGTNDRSNLTVICNRCNSRKRDHA